MKLISKDFGDTLRRIKQGQVDPVYFLNGNDFFLQKLFLDEIEKSLSRSQQIDRIFLVPELTDYSQLMNDLNAMSFFPASKLFILYNPTNLKGLNREELLHYCKSPNENNCLVIIIEKYDPKMKLIIELSKSVGVINTSPPLPYKMNRWVKFLLDIHELKASPSAVDRLLDFFGDSVYHLFNEIEKIKIGLGEKGKVEEKDVIKFIGWRRHYFPWHLLDAVGKKDFVNAVYIGKILLSEGIDISILISRMTIFFQEILFRRLRGQNRAESVNSDVWLGGFIGQRLGEYKNNYHKIELRNIFGYLLEADKKIKSSGVSSTLIMTPLIYKIVQGNG